MATGFSMAKATVVAHDEHGDVLSTWEGVSVVCRSGVLTLRRFRSQTIEHGPVEGIVSAAITGRNRWQVTTEQGTTFDITKAKCNCGGA